MMMMNEHTTRKRERKERKQELKSSWEQQWQEREGRARLETLEREREKIATL
jgi:hypothetical protein